MSKQSDNGIVASIGRFFNNIGMDDIAFCRTMEVVENLRDFIDKSEKVAVICPHKSDAHICPYVQGKQPRTKLKRVSLFTDENIARAMGLSYREFRHIRKRTVGKINNLLPQTPSKNDISQQ